MKNMKLVLTLLTLTLIGSSGSSAWARGGMSTGGVANPASMQCVQLGGRIELFTSNSNERIGLCQFADRSSIEAWTLFRGPRFPGNTKLLKLLTAAN